MRSFITGLAAIAALMANSGAQAAASFTCPANATGMAKLLKGYRVVERENTGSREYVNYDAAQFSVAGHAVSEVEAIIYKGMMSTVYLTLTGDFFPASVKKFRMLTPNAGDSGCAETECEWTPVAKATKGQLEFVQVSVDDGETVAECHYDTFHD